MECGCAEGLLTLYHGLIALPHAEGSGGVIIQLHNELAARHLAVFPSCELVLQVLLCVCHQVQHGEGHLRGAGG